MLAAAALTACSVAPAASYPPSTNATPPVEAYPALTPRDEGASPAVASVPPSIGADVTSIPSTPTGAPSPSSGTAPLGGVLGWEEIGSLGPRGTRYPESEWIESIVGFDAGYLAFQQTVGPTGGWANRVWFSGDGEQWQVIESFDSTAQVSRGYERLAVGTNGHQVLLFTRSDVTGANVWTTADGVEWQTTAGDLLPDHDWQATAVWPAGDGWQAIFREDYGCQSFTGVCYRHALWESQDGTRWARVGTIADETDPGAEVSASVAENGALLLALDDVLLTSLDAGRSWDEVVAGDCTRLISTIRSGSSTWLVGGTFFDGGALVCTADHDSSEWETHVLTETSVLRFPEIVETDHGWLFVAGRDCYERNDCPPHLEQYLSGDGESWTSLERAVSDLGGAVEMRAADGPAGVIALAGFGESANGVVVTGPREITAWRLVDH